MTYKFKYREPKQLVLDFPPTYHAVQFFIQKIQAEIKLLTESELELWICKELRPYREPIRERVYKNRRVMKILKPTFEEFMESRKEAA